MNAVRSGGHLSYQWNLLVRRRSTTSSGWNSSYPGRTPTIYRREKESASSLFIWFIWWSIVSSPSATESLGLPFYTIWWKVANDMMKSTTLRFRTNHPIQSVSPNNRDWWLPGSLFHQTNKPFQNGGVGHSSLSKWHHRTDRNDMYPTQALYTGCCPPSNRPPKLQAQYWNYFNFNGWTSCLPATPLNFATLL